jgi:5'-3' exonuclease
MGIPYYFSYIVRNHTQIIKKISNNPIKINNFFLDCNSIIYDTVHALNYAELTETIYTSIIQGVVIKIENYVKIVKPNNIVYIAFDGVAPVAKLQQQRERRFKSWYQTQIQTGIFSEQQKITVDPFNTTAITPGTKFMYELNTKIKKHFMQQKNVIISGSNEVGEGEHKLFEYIRGLPKDSINLVYGLDADLIMLSILHLPEHPFIYLYRETPEFIKSLDSSLEPNEHYLLDIPELANTIIVNMSALNQGEKDDNKIDIIKDYDYVYDYIFLCFFLGNDFLPHFPSLNIRTGGVDKLLNAYKHVFSKGEFLTDGKTIFWKNVRKLLTHLSTLEEQYLVDELRLRDKIGRRYLPENTPEEKFKKFESVPMVDRELEKYVNPRAPHWQTRYYNSLFSVKVDETEKKKICNNFLEGLEWTLKYYNKGCPHWRWYYKYEYPPLLADLIRYTPYFETEFISKNDCNPIEPLVQLCFVLPRHSLELLPAYIKIPLLKKYAHYYPDNCEFVWAFCKYFWESHALLPDIDLDDLEGFVLQQMDKKIKKKTN